MKTDFWHSLPVGFTVLAPMEDVTDTVMRRTLMTIARPDVFFTEFTSVDGICALRKNSDLQSHVLDSRSASSRGPAARVRFASPAFLGIHNFQKFTNGLLQRLVFSQEERPVAAQIWGTDPGKFFQAAKVVSRLGFDGIDINMGCPQKRITKVGGGSALIGEFNQVSEIIAATKEGAGKLPVSVKTRIGKKTVMTEEWIGFLLQQDLLLP
jgi:tRNA-dihydrouridine synthase